MTASRRLGVLLCVAVLGVLFAGGLVVSLAGMPAVLAYAASAVALLGVAMARGRHLLAPAAPPALPPDRTCTCCTASQHDPARVV